MSVTESTIFELRPQPSNKITLRSVSRNKYIKIDYHGNVKCSSDSVGSDESLTFEMVSEGAGYQIKGGAHSVFLKATRLWANPKVS